MDMLIVSAVGVAAALCSMSSFLPQVIKIVRERDASAVSLRMYLVTVTGFSLWSVYGMMLGSWPLIVSNLVSLGLSAAILVLKLRFGDGDKQDGDKQKGPQSPAAPMQLEPEGSD